MDITFLLSSLGGGGVERVISVLSSRLMQNEHKIRIITTSGRNKTDYNIGEDIEVLDIWDWYETSGERRIIKKIDKFLKKFFPNINSEKVLVPYKKENLCGHEKVCYMLSCYFKHNRADFLIGGMCGQNIEAAFCRTPKRCKVISMEATFPERSDLSEQIKEIRNLAYEKSDMCVFQTDKQKEFFSERIQKKSCVIANPIKDNLPMALLEKSQKVVTFCRLTEAKNLHLLIDAFKIFYSTHQDYFLEIYGDGELRDEVIRKIDNEGLTACVRLYPFCRDIHEKIKDSALYVMSSDFEGLPNALMEAMAMGMPVVSTDCMGGGASTLIEHGKNGLVVPIRDVDALSKAMAYMIDNPGEAKRMGKNAEYVREQYSTKVITKKWLDLFESMK